MGDLQDPDAEAIAAAIRILNEAGLNVSKTYHVTQEERGVSFKLKCHAPTRAPYLRPQLEAVKDAAIDAQEFGMGGEPVPEDGDRDV